MLPDWLITFLTIAFSAGSAYGAIRYDLGRLHEKASNAAASAAQAHKRIDDFYQQRRANT